MTDNPLDHRQPHGQCGAKTKNGTPCKNRPMENGRCRFHGGATPRGIASPSFRHGRYSKALPARMIERFQEAQDDPEILNLRSDIALVDARLADVLVRVDSGESGRLWAELSGLWTAFKDAMAANDKDAMSGALSALDQGISRGTGDWAAWSEVLGLLERRRKLVESEQKRLTAMQQMFTAEQGVVMVTALINAVQRNVHDRDVLAAIQADISDILSRSSL